MKVYPHWNTMTERTERIQINDGEPQKIKELGYGQTGKYGRQAKTVLGSDLLPTRVREVCGPPRPGMAGVS